MVSFKQLAESVGEPQPAPSQDDLRKEVERLRLEIQLASRSIEINEGEVEVDVQAPPEAIAKGFSSPDDFVIKTSTLKYTDGGSYQGEVLGTLRHGKGTYTRADGAKYSGNWRYDSLQGQATALTPDGHTYDGEWQGGRATGRGVSTYPNGARYEGDFVNDGRHGWGIQTFPSREQYEGEWQHDKITGQGRWTYPDGSYFEGEWADGERTKGKFVVADGSEEYCGGWSPEGRSGHGVQYSRGAYKYAGEWLADKQHGKGKCIYADGSVYDGDWREGQRHGQGKLTNGAFCYEGHFADDLCEGQGVCKEDNGDRYIGLFSQGKRHGLGRCHYADGSKYEGEWREGKRCGQGTCVYANGDVYKGEWANDRRHGTGVCKFADGTKFRGRWDDDGWVQSAADPGKCKIAGSGVTKAEAGKEATFAILARDEAGNRRLNGGDEFQVMLLLQPEGGSPVEEGEEGDPVSVTATVKDNDDGTYQVVYVATVAGVYQLCITQGAGGMEHVADSPYPVRVIPAKPCPEKAYVHGPGRSQAVVGEAARFEIEARDSFGNRCFGDGLAEDLRLDVHLEGPGGRQLPVEIASTRDGRLLCSYTPDAEGYYRLHVEHGGRALRGTPYSVHVLSVEEAAARQENEQALAVVHEDEGDHEGPGENEVSEGCMEGAGRATKAAGAAIPDTMRLWEQIAAAAYAADGVTDGWDSEEEGKKETEEEAYMRKHPNVPVVENLEDLWLVSKLQQERKAKEEKEKAAKLEKLKSQLESAYGVGQAPTQEEVQEALKDILAAERAGGSEKVEAPGAVDTERSSKYPVQVVRRPKKEELVAAAALLDDLA